MPGASEGKAATLMDLDVSTRPLKPDTGMTLTDAAYRQLRTDIIAGVRAPTERLRIERLSRIYEVGPTPLREALQRLAADGLVIATGNRGFAVAPLDADEFEDLNTARTAIELQMLRMAIEKGDAMWESGVVAAAYRLGKLDDRIMSDNHETLSEWETANRDFHYATVSACGSKWLLHVRSLLHDQCERYRRASVDLKRHERDLAEEHRQIAAAVLERDADRASDLVAAHFERTTRFLVQVLGART
ncbi:putative transcriptional regulator, GntR family [Aurantimonas manganoxydans SI85-9A1]|uniref:Putative transcriptional regulator, GntR family n=2 Tax=Aurantimonas manganoxydans TaxID=651183 RepID=Q1YHR8_AURMS|nr:putative transcriptional regulator, GntR family [Aurantimonas manganoxydans SI85-9A1]